jgi:hypothetical protein
MILNNPLAEFALMNEGQLDAVVLFLASLFMEPFDLQAALATHIRLFTVQDLVPHDLQQWRDQRTQISFRQEGRRKQFRFRKDPGAYLALLEEQLVKQFTV